jgi:hypothetical protein
VSAFRLHVWREWREHRFALLALGGVLPSATWLLATQLSQGTLGNPLFHAAVALAFALVMLAVVGGELLGCERRGPGLRWLERLPTGLEGAFRAKLAFHVLTLALAPAYGYGIASALARLREASLAGAEHELGLLVVSVLVLGTWTFAVSTWVLRGGLSVLAAALVLIVIGLPTWHVIAAGYEPTEVEVGIALALLVVSGLVAASLGFVHGARHGRGTLASALFGLAPALGLVGLSASWAAVRMVEREHFDPHSPDFHMAERTISGDGRTALVIGAQRIPRWDAGKLPHHVLEIDLANGTFDDLGCGDTVRQIRRHDEDERGMPVLDDLVIEVDGEPPLVFAAYDGSRRAYDPTRDRDRRWESQGLGVRYVRRTPAERDVVRDPFRQRDYPVAHFADLISKGQLLVRPGRWLHTGCPLSWTWFEPESGVREPVDWPEQSRVLALFEDGRILLANPVEGLQVVHPERGESRTIDTLGVDVRRILPNVDGLHVPRRTADPVADARGTIVLRTHDCDWLVIDEESLAVRRLQVACGLAFGFLRRVGEDAAIVADSSGFARVDLVTGAVTPLWPRARPD